MSFCIDWPVLDLSIAYFVDYIYTLGIVGFCFLPNFVVMLVLRLGALSCYVLGLL